MSYPGRQDLRIYTQAAWLTEIVFVDGADAAIDLTGWTWKAEIRDVTGPNGVLLATFTVDTTDAAIGVLALSLTAAASEALSPYAVARWDLFRTDNDQAYLYGSVHPTQHVTEVP